MKTNDSIDQAQVFKDWLIAKMENVRYRYEHGAGDWPDLSACWEFVNEAGHRAATLGWSDLAEEARTYDDLDDFRSVNVFLSKCLARCSDPSMIREEVLLTEQEGIIASSLDDASEALESEEPPKLATRFEKAYQSFRLAAIETCREVTDREAYDWIELNVDKYDDLPDFSTWSRYLRAAREHYGTQKNSPRAGRSGRSIVRHDQK